MPSVVTPQLCADPALTAANVNPPRTATGLVRPIAVPSPSSPLTFWPQQYAAPPVVTAHVWKLPALSDPKVSPLATAAGITRSIFVPSPSSPAPLRPQQ